MYQGIAAFLKGILGSGAGQAAGGQAASQMGGSSGGGGMLSSIGGLMGGGSEMEGRVSPTGGYQDMSQMHANPMGQDVGAYPEEEGEPSIWEMMGQQEQTGTRGKDSLLAQGGMTDMSQAYATGQMPSLMAVRPQEQFKSNSMSYSPYLMSLLGGGR